MKTIPFQNSEKSTSCRFSKLPKKCSEWVRDDLRCQWKGGDEARDFSFVFAARSPRTKTEEAVSENDNDNDRDNNMTTTRTISSKDALYCLRRLMD